MINIEYENQKTEIEREQFDKLTENLNDNEIEKLREKRKLQNQKKTS